jgi:hypothetical protein
VGLIRYPDRCQFTGAVQLGKVARVSPVSLDPLAWLPRYQRWRHHGTVVPHAGELPLPEHIANHGGTTAMNTAMKGVARIRPSTPNKVPRIVCDTIVMAGGRVPARFCTKGAIIEA